MILRADPVARFLGPYRGHDPAWAYHIVVVCDDRVYDAFTGHEGSSTEAYKALWTWRDAIDFGF